MKPSTLSESKQELATEGTMILTSKVKGAFPLQYSQFETLDSTFTPHLRSTHILHIIAATNIAKTNIHT